MSKEQSSNILYIAKALAIICSVSAHMPYGGIVGRILSLIGTMGVPFFFFTSGLLYKFDNRKMKWARYLKKVIGPWCIGGVLIWAISRWRNYNDLRAIDFILGNGSYLYYLTVLLMIYLAWSFIPKSYAWVLFALSVVRIVLAHVPMAGIINSNLYLSVLYWNFYFTLGVLISEKAGNWEEFVNQVVKVRQGLYILWLALAILYLQLPEISYFTWIALPFSILAIGILIACGYELRNIKLFIQIGKNTLPIYIYHLLIAGWIAGKCQNIVIFHLIGPLIATFVTYGLIVVACFVLEKFQMKKLVNIIFGYVH